VASKFKVPDIGVPKAEILDMGESIRQMKEAAAEVQPRSV
jgi:hypothetical protein